MVHSFSVNIFSMQSIQIGHSGQKCARLRHSVLTGI